MRNTIMTRMGISAVCMAAADTGGIGQEVGRKLSVGEMGWTKPEIQKLVISDQVSQHHLCRFVGVATGAKPYKIKEGDRAGETAFGIQGQFEGTSAADGSVKAGTVLYLPGYLTDAVLANFIDDTVAGVRIAYDIYAQYDERSATSYTFTGRDLINSTSQGVEEVKVQIQALPMPSKTLALAAPEKK
jgi:hypothetical protein